jgi:hypothetical protein
MTMKKQMLILVLMMVAGVAALTVLSGCDSADGIDGVSVSPSSVTLSGSTNSVTFTAQTKGNLGLPLEWHVANPALGIISGSSGSNAVYVAKSGQKGTQVVSVKDQYGNEGFASIEQI